MSIKKISIKINNSEKTIEQHSVIAGQQGIGQQNQPLHINAKKNVNYLLIDEETNFAPENIAVKRVDKNLFIAFEGSDIEQPDIIIENYFADNGESGYHEGSSNLIIGQHENGQYFPYIPESAEKSDAISQLADGQATGQAIGGDALAPVWAFNPWWLAALIPIAGVIASSSGGGSRSSKLVEHTPEAKDDDGVTKTEVPVILDVLKNDTDLDNDIDLSTAVIVTNGTKGTATFDADGKLVYTPNSGEVGTDTITYQVTDKNGNISNIAEVTIEITPSLPSVVDVYEKGLRTDGTADSALAVTTGTATLANPNDKPITEQDLKITAPTTTLTSGGKTVIWEATNDGFVGKTSEGEEVIAVTITDTKNENGQTSVDYQVDLKGLIDHPIGTDTLKVDFGLTNGVDIVDTEIIIHDDKPFSDNVEVVVQAPTDNTFYANVIISLDLSSSMGKDDSGILGGYTRSGMKTRYDAALDSIESLLKSYEERLNSADSGDVRVSLNGFADKASVINPSLQTTHSTSHWFTLDEAKDLINSLKGRQGDLSRSLNIGVNTNYDAALQQIVDSYNNHPASGTGPVTEQSVDNTFFFISDGTPNMGNKNYGQGISEQSPQDYVPGSAYTDIGEDKWTEFLVDNGIRSVAIGIGQDMVTVNNGKTGSDYLKPVAFDGKQNTDNDHNDVIVLKDMSSLGNILSKYVPNENVIESSFSKGKDANSSLTFGADGMKSISVEVDGITYKYDPSNKSVTSDGSDKGIWADFGNGEVAIKTNAGGLFSISLGEKNFGDFSYRPSTTRPIGVDKEEFTLTLTDNDGTSYQPSITVNISNLKESTSVSSITSDLSLLKLFSQENTMELHEMDVDGSIAPTNLNGFMNSSLDALQENQAAII
ncbi:Ig-like domain-containing protein [Providencia rettgeri]|uniref:Ig-like domain-containing protein n=1 Tax=Providencia rettgeri TaxID=587 RepID=UPI0025544E05|nr:Ig-like domain-containing protein [Providencia rettgeri]